MKGLITKLSGPEPSFVWSAVKSRTQLQLQLQLHIMSLSAAALVQFLQQERLVSLLALAVHADPALQRVGGHAVGVLVCACSRSAKA